MTIRRGKNIGGMFGALGIKCGLQSLRKRNSAIQLSFELRGSSTAFRELSIKKSGVALFSSHCGCMGGALCVEL